MSTGQRDPPIWESLEAIVNEVLCSISIVRREGTISVSLDDDKVWIHLSPKTKMDLFDLKYTTRVQANRKGLTAHTAIS